MLEPSLNQLMHQIDTRYLLVNVAAARAREIAEEAERQGIQLNEKPVKLAIEEIAEGRLTARALHPESSS
ncbi:MAG: DNA-directed RNA polymerase subunit omega [Oscillospiraceae bacterium]|jgi:DNA-directed RNA polymerase subunit omega|nr:DNA-directed RNA polymerase subunit omega [Oscillospiraceae bacterium]MDR2670315.1 DNA-directed RNA polymerase subunit omega [Oscillospiraceae bacterium]